MPDVLRWLRRDQRKRPDHPQGRGADAPAVVGANKAGRAPSSSADDISCASASAAPPPPPPPPPPPRTDRPSAELDAAVLRGEEPFSLAEPFVWRVGNLGPEAYWEWVHRPVPGAPRFFSRPWVEACSKTAWWVIPSVWLPVALVVCLAGARHQSCALSLSGAPPPPADCADPVEWSAGGVWLQARSAARHFPPSAFSWQLAGAAFWQLLEYAIHRGLFHAKFPGYYGRTFHFLFHGCHHKYPMDGLRLVFPPVPAAPLMLSIFLAMVAVLGVPRACSFGCGTLTGYVLYDCFHYACHHGAAGVWPRVPVLGALRHRHQRHHYHGQHDAGFGITTLFFDVVFGTLGEPLVGGGGARGEGWLARRLMGAAAGGKAEGKAA